jgi:V/A-type H+-transporting ATPase subunit I
MIKEEGAGYLIEDPDDTDHPPTLITNPAWIRIIDPVFKFMNTLPGYREYDISPYFLIFFSVFFAMLIGDAGYGTLFLGVTWVLRRKFKKAPAQPFFLMYLLSVCTMIWGAITGTWFGIEKVAELPFFNALVIPQIDSFSSRSQNSVIFICFVIGAVQLSIARIIKVARYINSPLAVAEAGWVFILWGMFFAAGRFVLGRVFPSFAFWLLGGGILMVLFFSDPRKGWIKGALSTLADLPLSVIGSFSDIVSYLRLFAVGYASVVVAQSFNNMAVGGGVDSIAGSLMAALVLFLGHALNIILGFMAVIVHGIRLNMLEFSGHLGMQWTGKKYDPFRSK